MRVIDNKLLQTAKYHVIAYVLKNGYNTYNTPFQPIITSKHICQS